MSPPHKRARLSDFCEDVPRTSQEADFHLKKALAESTRHVGCPICGESFLESEITRHASACGEGDMMSTNGIQSEVQGLSEEVDTVKNERAVNDEAVPLNKGAEPKPTNFRRRAFTRGPKAMPFYKVMEGMPFAVDAFAYGAIDGCIAYFLSHFHSDHYGGLSSRWAHGPIYCTHQTARLVRANLRVGEMYLKPLPLDEPTLIPGTGIHVTCISANHCPGSCLFLFEGPRSRCPHHVRYLHCGDFRASPMHARHPALQDPIDLLYLDTTYLNPQYCFPPQAQVIQACTDLVTKKPVPASLLTSWLNKPALRDAPLVVVGTYSIGKERLFIALAEALDTHIFCIDARKYRTYALLDDPVLQKRLTKDPTRARVHVVSLNSITAEALHAYIKNMTRRGMSISHTLAFRPTGWTFKGGVKVPPPSCLAALVNVLRPPLFTHKDLEPQRGSTSHLSIYTVPYSEHSSFYELMAFMLSMQHKRMIPTVSLGANEQRMRPYMDAFTEASGTASVHIQPRSHDYW